jgi:hypothetical protein
MIAFVISRPRPHPRELRLSVSSLEEVADDTLITAFLEFVNPIHIAYEAALCTLISCL